MKRVLRMLRWIQAQWQERAAERMDIAPELRAGLRAYALHQVHTHRKVAESFYTGWDCSMASAVRRVLERDGQVHRELVRGESADELVEGGVADLEAAASVEV
jgi:hypothetical protein